MTERIFSSKIDLTDHLKDEGITLVYFFNNYCAPCRQLRPKVSDLVSELPYEVELMLIDAEKFPGLTAEFGIFSFPVILIMIEGKEYRRYNQYVSLKSLKEELDRLASLYLELD